MASEPEDRFSPTLPAKLGNARSPFYQMNVAFTGKLETMTRDVAEQRIVERGGFTMRTVTKSTDFLVVGLSRRTKAISSKQRAAKDLIAAGHRIKILDESDFLEMIHGRV